MIRVLFVCMGNICRSPLAEGVFRHLAEDSGLSDRFDVDSAGTYGYHSDQGADRRATQTAHHHGIDIRPHRARAVEPSDFEEFDYIYVMDRQNYADLMLLCPREHKGKVSRLLSAAPQLGIDEVPDPYYGRGDGFEEVFAMIEASCRAVLEDLRERHC